MIDTGLVHAFDPGCWSCRFVSRSRSSAVVPPIPECLAVPLLPQCFEDDDEDEVKNVVATVLMDDNTVLAVQGSALTIANGVFGENIGNPPRHRDFHDAQGVYPDQRGYGSCR